MTGKSMVPSRIRMCTTSPVAGGPPKTVFIVVNNEVYTSTDEGATWTPLHVKEVFPWTYPRGIAVQPGNAKTVFVTWRYHPGRTGT